jgi:hypothetical protein
MSTSDKGKGVMYSNNAGVTWTSIHNNHGYSFVWGFINGGASAPNRVISYEASCCYIENINNPVFEGTTVSFNQTQQDGFIPTTKILGVPIITASGVSVNYRVMPMGTIAAQPVQITVFDMLGREIKTLVNDYKFAGTYQVTWDGMDDKGSSVANTVYFLNVKSGNQSAAQKVVLSR